MTTNTRGRLGRFNEAGLTLVELMIYMIIASVVVASVYRVMITQSRAYTDQQEMMDARQSVRGAAVLLASELRQLSASDGDLYALGPNALTLRSIRGSGVVCDWDSTQRRFGLYGTQGELDATSVDSALVYHSNTSVVNDDTWGTHDITQLWGGGGGGMATCAWPSSPATERVVGVGGDSARVAGISIGAPFRAFRQVEYGLYQEDGRWWLGRRVGGAASWERLTGPLLAPANGGLVFTYYDANGNTTANPAEVRTVEIAIRGESAGQARNQSTGAFGERVDSIRTRAFLRG